MLLALTLGLAFANGLQTPGRLFLRELLLFLLLILLLILLLLVLLRRLRFQDAQRRFDMRQRLLLLFHRGLQIQRQGLALRFGLRRLIGL